MSEISELLREQSESIKDELQKQAEGAELLALTKQAAVNSLVEGGVSPEEADELVKSAEELQGLDEVVFLDPVFISDVLEKAAQYIEQQDKEVQELRAKIDSNEELSKVAAFGPLAENLREIGFSQDQVNTLSKANMLDKVAQLTGKPWEPGESSSRPSINSMDPIERFCFGTQN